MTKSMLRPGKQHNFRVTVDATWTEAFNRLADKHKWSANKTMNILLHNALHMMEQSDETITVDVSPQDLDTLLRLKQDPQIFSQEPARITPPSRPVRTNVPQAETIQTPREMPTPPARATVKREQAPPAVTPEEENLSPLEKARRQLHRSTL